MNRMPLHCEWGILVIKITITENKMMKFFNAKIIVLFISCLSLQALTATEIKKSAKKEKGYWNYEIINKTVLACQHS
jgi:hypothetical protein